MTNSEYNMIQYLGNGAKMGREMNLMATIAPAMYKMIMRLLDRRGCYAAAGDR